jgi:hypothetical protein
MTRGLVRKNNLSDLSSSEQARTNLGLTTADYNRIRGLFTSAGVSNVDVQRIASSTGNFQQQIDGLTITLSGIVPSLYVSRSGDTVSGTWTNTGYIQPSRLVQSGVILGSSSDALFTLSVSGLSYALSTSTLTMNSGLTVQGLRDNGGVVFASGVVANKLVPMQINGRPYFLEAG